jgi:hypothetical protein
MFQGREFSAIIYVCVFSVLLFVSPQTVSASNFKNCAQLKTSYSNVIARSVADKSRFTSKDSYAAQAGGGIVVKPKVYRANSVLDFDRDGLLCEDDLEMAVNFVRVAELFKGMLNEGSSSSLNGWGNCSFRGKNMWGSVYISDNRFSSDFVVYRSSNSFSADLKVFLTSSRFSTSSCGEWYLSSSPFNADFSIFLTDNQFSADFSIFFTTSRFGAGRN